MGILERIEERLINIEESIEVLNSASGNGLVLETNDTDDNETNTDVVDSNGVVWDERIHTANKGKTLKDVWKRKPGLNNDFFNEVMAELQLNSVKSATKAPPVKKSPPAKKPPPSKKAPPSKSNTQNFKGQALKDINMICKMHDASFEMVVANILEKHGIDTFDGLPENLHEEVSIDVTQWLEGLKSVQSEIDALIKMSRDTEHSQDINDAIKVYIQEAGADDSLLGSVPIDKLIGLKAELIDYSNQWAEFFKE